MSGRRESSSRKFFINIFFQEAGHWRSAPDLKCLNIILSIKHIIWIICAENEFTLKKHVTPKIRHDRVLRRLEITKDLECKRLTKNAITILRMKQQCKDLYYVYLIFFDSLIIKFKPIKKNLLMLHLSFEDFNLKDDQILNLTIRSASSSIKGSVGIIPSKIFLDKELHNFSWWYSKDVIVMSLSIVLLRSSYKII